MKINLNVKNVNRTNLFLSIILRASKVFKNEKELKTFQQELISHLYFVPEYRELVAVCNVLNSSMVTPCQNDDSDWIFPFIQTCLNNQVRAHKVSEWLRKLHFDWRVQGNEQKTRYVVYKLNQLVGYMVRSSQQDEENAHA